MGGGGGRVGGAVGRVGVGGGPGEGGQVGQQSPGLRMGLWQRGGSQAMSLQ